MVRRARGQASLEMTLATVGVLMLMFGSAKIFFWMAGRTIARQQYYEQTRGAAGRQTLAAAQRGPVWNDPTRVSGTPTNPDPCDPDALDIFEEC